MPFPPPAFSAAAMHDACFLLLMGGARSVCLCSPPERLRELLTCSGVARVNHVHLGFSCGYDMSELIDVVRDLPNLVTLTVMTEPTAELLHTLSACLRLTLLLLQGSSLSCHIFHNILRKLRAKHQLAWRFPIQVEQVTYEPDREDR